MVTSFKTASLAMVAILSLGACSTPGITFNGDPNFDGLSGLTTDDLAALAGDSVVSKSIGIDDISYDLDNRVLETPGTLRINGKAQNDLKLDLALRQGKFIATSKRGNLTATPSKVLLTYGSTEAIATVAASNGEGAGNDFFTATYSRFGTQEMPTAGGASFNGDYAGVFGSGRDNLTAAVSGRVAIYADFGNARVDGTISNRVMKDLRTGVAIGTMNDTSLSSSSLSSDGLFAGNARDGAPNTPGWRFTTGNYEGLVAGDRREQVVGGVTLQHETVTGSSFEELGVFHAEK